MHLSGKSHLSHRSANVDSKLCRSLEDGHKLHRKVESSSSEAKIVQIGVDSSKIFQAERKRGPMNCASFIRGKNQAANSDFVRKLPRVPGVSKQ